MADSYLLGYDSTNTVFRNNGIPEINEKEYHLGTKFSTPQRLGKKQEVYVCVCVYMHVCMNACMHVYMYECMYATSPTTTATISTYTMYV